jgi:prepilin-type N-terminal cleavage/methylation domain-containing protein
MRRVRDLLHPHGDDRGLTLPEVIITMFILGVVLAGVQTTLIIAQRTVGANVVRVDQSQQGRLAMESMSKVLRTAVLPSQLNGTCSGCDLAAFLRAESNKMQFYANINNAANIVGPSRVTYERLANGELWETIQPPNAHAPTDYNYQYCTVGSPGCVVKSRILAKGVQSTVPLFTYYNKSGTVLGSGGVLTSAQLSLVDSVDVYVSVKASPNSTVPATSFTTRVSLPNADSVPQPSSSP